MLEEIELEILTILYEEKKPMRASEISKLLDVTYQLVGKRTEKLKQNGLVSKIQDNSHTKSKITEKARNCYF